MRVVDRNIINEESREEAVEEDKDLNAAALRLRGTRKVDDVLERLL